MNADSESRTGRSGIDDDFCVCADTVGASADTRDTSADTRGTSAAKKIQDSQLIVSVCVFC